MTGAPRPQLLERPRTRIEARRRTGVPVSLALLVLGLVALAGGAASVARDASAPGVGEVAIVSASTSALAVEYADAPSVELVNYEHGEDVSYAIELRNDGPLPVTVEDVPISGMVDDLRLIRPTQVLIAPDGTAPADATVDRSRPFEPFRLARGASRTVVVTGVFDNCVYYTERAMDLIGAQPVTWSVAGWSTTTDVALSSQLAVRSPYLRVCPNRVMDRGARTRTGTGTL